MQQKQLSSLDMMKISAGLIIVLVLTTIIYSTLANQLQEKSVTNVAEIQSPSIFTQKSQTPIAGASIVQAPNLMELDVEPVKKESSVTQVSTTTAASEKYYQGKEEKLVEKQISDTQIEEQQKAETVDNNETVNPDNSQSSVKNYTEEDLEYTAILIYCEAGGDACSDDTRIKVGNVAWNRVHDDRFPNTILEVLTAPKQYGTFSQTGVVWPQRASLEIEKPAVKRAYACAKRVLEGEKQLPDDAIWQAEFPQGDVICFDHGFYFGR